MVIHRLAGLVGISQHGQPNRVIGGRYSSAPAPPALPIYRPSARHQYGPAQIVRHRETYWGGGDFLFRASARHQARSPWAGPPAGIRRPWPPTPGVVFTAALICVERATGASSMRLLRNHRSSVFQSHASGDETAKMHSWPISRRTICCVYAGEAGRSSL